MDSSAVQPPLNPLYTCRIAVKFHNNIRYMLILHYKQNFIFENWVIFWEYGPVKWLDSLSTHSTHHGECVLAHTLTLIAKTLVPVHPLHPSLFQNNLFLPRSYTRLNTPLSLWNLLTYLCIDFQHWLPKRVFINPMEPCYFYRFFFTYRP